MSKIREKEKKDKKKTASFLIPIERKVPNSPLNKTKHQVPYMSLVLIWTATDRHR